jgi:hypothetical protein
LSSQYKDSKSSWESTGSQSIMLVCVGCILLTKSLLCNVAIIIKDAVYFRVFITEKCFKMFKEDSVQIPTQRSRIPRFRPDGLVLRRDAHKCREAKQFKNASVQTSWQHIRTHFRDREDSAFLHRHRVGRQLAIVRTLGQHRPNAEILDKEIACIHSASVRMSG